MEEFKSRVRDALGQGSKAVQMQIVNQDTDDLPTLVDKLIDQSDEDFAVSSFDIAKKLTDVQQRRSIPGGIVVVFTGTQGFPKKKFLGVIKAEIHSAYEKEVNKSTNEISLKFVEEVLLTPGTRLYKTVGFFKTPLPDESEDLNDSIVVMVSDYQISKADGKAAAKYFYADFLGCGYPETSARTTKKFYEATTQFIEKLDVDSREKSDLFNALTTYMKVDNSSTISSAEFASSYFDLDTQDAFTSHMEEVGVPITAFTKDIEHIESKLKFRKVNFCRNIKIIAPSGVFKDYVTIEPIDGEPDESGAPQEWTKVIIKDRVRTPRMNESELKDLWDLEKNLYEKWGGFVVDSVSSDLANSGEGLGSFLKAPAKFRLKDDQSLIEKAFYRSGKKYTDPYAEIEDKVGTRFIVLLLGDIKKICNIIETSQKWTFDACKHFDEDKENNPLLFTYQSVHYILRPRSDFEIDGVTIPSSTPCEVQIRTLLQHAHAELTHDAIYKAKRAIQPKVHRTVAKSMALIETTDEFFMDVTRDLNGGPLEDFEILKRLNGVYYSLTGIESHSQKSSLVLWDEFEMFIDEGLVDSIQEMIDKNSTLSKIIISRYSENSFYQQCSVLFIYWLLKKHKNRILNNWPFPKKMLELFANDLGISTWDGD